MQQLQKQQLNEIFVRVKAAEKYRPVEIRRQIRHISEMSLFKAKEFRTLLMFTGQYLLFKDILNVQQYNNFILLSYIMRKINDPAGSQIAYENRSTQSLIEIFLTQFKSIHG